EHRIGLGYEGPEPGAPLLTRPGHPPLLKEMMRNLLAHALNFAPSSAEQPGVVTLHLRNDPLGHSLVLQVEDNGPGIPAPERERISEPCYRALGTTSKAAASACRSCAKSPTGTAPKWRSATPTPADNPQKRCSVCAFNVILNI
ncbi:MAG: ATP-binding protein, partial [Burkholderiaceae bacterium]|nr:ATP-binding protein [Burkholderiaceae bacterium]